MINILKEELDQQKAVTGENCLKTNAPSDITTYFSDFFQVVTAKKNKDLILKVLKTFTQIIKSF